ncbi:MAG: hypothetical protein QF464_15930, partial [Myxococcota bacterium]|nr:hypothetical protein [Myxococcota bacterium]
IGITRLLKLVKFDVAAEKAGIHAFLTRGNIESSSVAIVGSLVYWLLLLLTLLIAVNAMGISEAEVIFQNVIAIIPRVVLAVVVLVLGLSFAGFIGDIVQTASANAQVAEARLLGNVSRYVIIIFVVVLALNQLQIDTQLLGQVILIVFGSICFAASLAFGLGCRDLAQKIAEGAWEREQAAARALDALSVKEEPAAEEP